MYYPDDSSEKHSGTELVIKSGANWFFVIAVLSVVNTIISLYLGLSSTFVIGFGFAAFTTAFAQAQGTTVTILMSTVTAVFTSLYVAMGIFSRRRHKWAFVTGLFVYAIDGLFLILVQDWYSIALHCLLLYLIFRGLDALKL